MRYTLECLIRPFRPPWHNRTGTLILFREYPEMPPEPLLTPSVHLE